MRMPPGHDAGGREVGPRECVTSQEGGGSCRDAAPLRLLFHWALLAPPEPHGRPAPTFSHVSTVRYPARAQQSLMLSNKAIELERVMHF